MNLISIKKLKNNVKKNIKSLSPFIIFWEANRPYWKWHVLIAVVISLCTIPYATIPWITKYFFDFVLAKNSINNLFYILFAYAFVNLFLLLIPIFESLVFVVLGMRSVMRLQLKCFKKFLNMPPALKNMYSSGGIVTHVIDDTAIASNYGGQKIIFPLVGISQLALTVPTAIVFSWEITLAQVPIFLCSYLLQKRMKRNESTLNNLLFYTRSKLNSIVHEHYANHELLSSGKIFRKSLDSFFRNSRKDIRLKEVRAINSSLSVRANLVSNILGNIVLWGIGAFLYFKNKITIGELVGIQTILPILFLNAQKLTAPFLAIRSDQSSAERLTNFLSTKTESENKLILKKDFNDKITCKDISFRYNTGALIIENMSFDILKGDCVRLIGPNGCGKSTLQKLICGTLTPSSGDATIDNVNISDLSNQSLRNLFSHSTQETRFFSESIKYNMEICCDIKSAKFKELLEFMKVDQIIEKLPQGWNTQIGVKGINLSVGQLKLLSLIRSFSSQAPILILDEPFTNLDSNIKEKLLLLIEREHNLGRTIIITTHDSNILPDITTICFYDEFNFTIEDVNNIKKPQGLKVLN